VSGRAGIIGMEVWESGKINGVWKGRPKGTGDEIWERKKKKRKIWKNVNIDLSRI